MKTMPTLKDIRVPGDTQDQQTTNAKSALPPVEFTVARGTTQNLLMIQDRQGPQDRIPTVSYRVYFLPAAFSPTSTGTTSTVPAPVVTTTAVRAAGRKVASLVADVKAPGLGTLLSIFDPVNFGQKGYYYCVGVNRSSVEAPPEHLVAAPVIADTAKVSLFDGTRVPAMEVYPGKELLSFGHKRLVRAMVRDKKIQSQTDVIGVLLNNGQKLVGSRDQKVGVHRDRNVIFTPLEKIDIGEKLRGETAGMPVILSVIGLVFYPRTAIRVVGLEVDGRNFVAESVLCR